MAKNQKSEESTQAQEQTQTEAPLVEAPVRDAAHYVVQPTSYKLPSHMQVRGEMPDGRFTEEVLRGGDEEDSSTSSWDAHPEENQPVPGIGPDDELPDTTGRAALRAEKR